MTATSNATTTPRILNKHTHGIPQKIGDLAGISTPRDTVQGLYPTTLCEGCGPVQVDHTGQRIHEPAITA